MMNAPMMTTQRPPQPTTPFFPAPTPQPPPQPPSSYQPPGSPRKGSRRMSAKTQQPQQSHLQGGKKEPQSLTEIEDAEQTLERELRELNSRLTSVQKRERSGKKTEDGKAAKGRGRDRAR
mmetsp:Transcript_4044/g.10356  ORF Transcript_4044/g.10356 Transcript_4044/m.10356 type:complete len:120 (+) Transcript_4044:3-362(+)